jgi:hypothetical protein
MLEPAVSGKGLQEENTFYLQNQLLLATDHLFKRLKHLTIMQNFQPGQYNFSAWQNF